MQILFQLAQSFNCIRYPRILIISYLFIVSILYFCQNELSVALHQHRHRAWTVTKCSNCNTFCSKTSHSKAKSLSATQMSLRLLNSQPFNCITNRNWLVCGQHSVSSCDVPIPTILSKYLWQLAERAISEKYTSKPSKRHTGKEFFGYRSLRQKPRTMMYMYSPQPFFYVCLAFSGMAKHLSPGSFRDWKRRGRELS